MKTILCETYVRSRGEAKELYLTATAKHSRLADALFRTVADCLREFDARILYERIFTQCDDLKSLFSTRLACYGNLDDGVAPTWLRSPESCVSATSVVQIHAISGKPAPESLGRNVRILRDGDAGLAVISGLEFPNGDFEVSANGLFAQLQAMLETNESSLAHLARTWLWVDSINRHYAALNRARTSAFQRAGLIAVDNAPAHLPASTGIGLRSANSSLSLDAIASIGECRPKTWLSAGNQSCALDYGSAFSRAASLKTPAGMTYYISGTAAVDAQGRTEAKGQPQEQVRKTIANIRAVLRDLGLNESDIVQGVAYVTSEVVKDSWTRTGIEWPLATVFSEICRPDLQFEIELTICPGAARRKPLRVYAAN